MIHDIAMQKLPVVIAIDRAGIVGEDGATHQGVYDLSYTRFIPNFTIMAPADENELQSMLKTAFSIKGPVALRYPRGTAIGVTLDHEAKELPVGKAEIRRMGKDVALIAIGNMVHTAEEAARMLLDRGIDTSVVNMRFLKPFDADTILSLINKTPCVAVIEENSIIGGLNSAVNEVLVGKKSRVLNIGLPDLFIEHGSPRILRDKYGLTPEKIADKVAEWLNQEIPHEETKTSASDPIVNKQAGIEPHLRA
jgi:1-deoxy-D-xylulose-5-phosphate synthase